VKPTIEDILQISLRTFEEEKGNLVPIESKVDSLIPIKRVFYVYGVPKGEVRGKHAHYKTNQVLICMAGECHIRCFDGEEWRSFTLNEPNQALFVPAGIWAEETYEQEGTVLMVLCDTAYAKSDYIFSMSKYKKWING
jgi:dTDP-4-dehydrorhamnose 3,5-epimerase-like enzyme